VVGVTLGELVDFGGFTEAPGFAEIHPKFWQKRRKPRTYSSRVCAELAGYFFTERVTEFPDLIDTEPLQEPVTVLRAEPEEQPVNGIPHLLHGLGVQIPRDAIGDVLLDGFLHRRDLRLDDADLY
jgi:hypothetical protein